MANVIKYSTTTPTNQSTLRRGNLVVAVGNAATSQFHSAGYGNGVDIPEGGYVVYTIGLNNNPKAFIAQDDNDLPSIARTLGGGNLTVLEAKVFLNAHTTTWTLNSFPPNIVTDGLVYYSDGGDMTSFMNNEPITNLVVYGTMLPSNPNATFISNSTYQSNVGGSQWAWSYYPNSNISPEGGMEWHPAISDPIGGSGAWLMKRRTGGNGESNWSSTPPGAIDETKDYTISVWCKTDQASCFRIHLNTTKNGSSYWGYASAFHSGNGLWEKLSLTIPANSGNTRINVVRCQSLYQYNADAYYKYFQVEEGSSATDFVNGTRPQNTLLNDLSGEGNDGTLVNGPTFNSNGYFDFDGTDDEIVIPDDPTLDLTTAMSFEFIVKANSSQNNLYPRLLDKSIYLIHLSQTSPFSIAQNVTTSSGLRQTSVGGAFTANIWTHIVCNYDGEIGKIYVDGKLVTTNNFGSVLPALTNNTGVTVGGNSGTGRQLNGSMAKTKIYSKVLSQSEVLQNYYQAPIVTDGLVFAVDAGNLVSYENGSTTTYSMTGSDTGTLTNGVGFDSGNGGYWDFDGVDDYIAIPTYTFGNGDWTVSMWINADNFANYNLISNSSGGPVANAFGAYGSKIYYQNYDGAWQSHFGNTTLSVGKWYMVTWVNYAGATSADGTMKMYVNGVTDSSIFNSYTANGGPCNVIGSRWGGVTYNGKISSCQFYDESLTDSQILQNYNAQSSRFK